MNTRDYIRRVVRGKRKLRAKEQRMTIDERLAVMDRLRGMLTLVTGQRGPLT